MRQTLKPISVLNLTLGSIALMLPAMRQEDMKLMKSMSDMKTMKPMENIKSMSGMMAVKGPTVPVVTGYSEGQKIVFIHTETSDPKIAKILTDMTGGSPVLVVPALASAPKEMLARIFVFTNVMKGGGPMGPLGGQPDIFGSHPGNPSYSPSREVTLVTWRDAISSRILKSASELKDAINMGAVNTGETTIVVKMPFLTWPRGTR